MALLLLCLPLAGQDTRGASSFTLDNGLRVWIRRSDKVEFAVTMVVYRTGLRDDADGKVGLANVVQRMVQNGATPSYKAGDARRKLQDEGYTLNTRLDVGGEAIPDATYFYSILRPEAVETAIKIEAERMRGAKFDDALLAQEKQQVRREIAAASTGIAPIIAKFTDILFSGHPYGRPRLGKDADIERVTLDDVKTRYNEQYHPDNAVVLVYGKVDIGKIRKAIEDAFRGIPKKGVAAKKIELKRAPGRIQKEFEEATLGKPFAALGFPMPDKTDPACPAIVLLSRYLVSTLSGERDLRELRAGMNVEADYVRLDRSALILFVQTDLNADLARAVDATRAALRRLQDTPLAEVTLKNYKKSVLSHLKRLDNAYFLPQPREQAPANGVAALLRKALAMHVFDPDREAFLKNLDTLTPQAVQDAAKKFLSDDNLTLVLFKRR